MRRTTEKKYSTDQWGNQNAAQATARALQHKPSEFSERLRKFGGDNFDEIEIMMGAGH
jgi:hypothetical protein